MTEMNTFKAVLVKETANNQFTVNIANRSVSDLPDNDLLINVHFHGDTSTMFYVATTHSPMVTPESTVLRVQSSESGSLSTPIIERESPTDIEINVL